MTVIYLYQVEKLSLISEILSYLLILYVKSPNKPHLAFFKGKSKSVVIS